MPNSVSVKDFSSCPLSSGAQTPAGSEELFAQWRLQTDMFRPLDWQTVDGVVADHVRYGGEGAAELAQHVVAAAGQLDPHVHEPVAAPAHHSRVSIENLILVSPA